MQQEKDLIQREIEKLSLFLRKLISTTVKFDPNRFEQELANIESDLKGNINLTLKEISKMKDSEFVKKVKVFDEKNLEYLIELISVAVTRTENLSKSNLAQKGILMIRYLDENSKTFSFKRLELKNTLQHYI